MTYPNELTNPAPANWPVRVNELAKSLRGGALYAPNDLTTTGLTLGYFGGFLDATTIADGTVGPLAASNTSYIVAHRTTGVVTHATNTTNWSDTATYGRLFVAVTSGSAITTLRPYHRMSGGIFDHSGTPGAVDASGVTYTPADNSDWNSSTDPGNVDDALDELASRLITLELAGGGGVELKGLRFVSDTGSTADSDPGAGLFKWNNATQGSATKLFIDNSTADGVSLTTLWSSLGQAGMIYIQQSTDSNRWQLWRWTAVTDDTGYRDFTVTLQAKSTSDIVDNVECYFDITEDDTGSSGTLGKHAIYIAAASMIPSFTGGCAALATIASAANQPDISTLDFDQTTQEYAQFSIGMPKSWNEGTVTFQAYWSHAATTTNFGVVWDLQAIALSDDDAIAQNFGTAQTSTDTGGTTNDIYLSPESSAITIAGTPAAQDMVFFRLSRVTGNGSDTMALDARLHGITLFITTDAENDA